MTDITIIIEVVTTEMINPDSVFILSLLIPISEKIIKKMRPANLHTGRLHSKNANCFEFPDGFENIFSIARSIIKAIKNTEIASKTRKQFLEVNRPLDISHSDEELEFSQDISFKHSMSELSYFSGVS